MCGRRTYRDGSLVHGASRSREKDVHHDRHGNAAEIHAQCRSDKKTTPQSRLRILNLLDAVFSERVRQVHQQHKTQKQEQHRANERNIAAPHLEEAVRYEKASNNQPNPYDDLRPPEAVLNRCSLVFGIIDADQKHRHNEMEETERKVDAVDGSVAEAFVAAAVDGYVVEEDALEFLDGPGCKEEP